MAVENAPWAVHGASHSAAVARVAQYNAVGGASGIGAPGDLQVRAMQTPSGQVRVAPGGVSVKNEYPGAVAEVYTARNVTETLVDVPASGSSGARTHYVVARIRDPQFAGEVQPEGDPKTAQYFFLEVVSSIPKNVPVEPLAKIVVPANTAAITNDMITDLRELAQPRRETRIHARPRVSTDSSYQNLLVGREPSGEYFPGGGGKPNEFTVDVPEWATMMILRPAWMSVRYQGGKSSWGSFWMEFGTEYRDRTWPNGQQYEFSTQRFAWDQNEGPTYRTNWLLMDTQSVHPKLRGKTVTFVYKAAVSKATSAQTGVASMDSMSGLGCEITFIEAPASDWQGVN